MRTRSLIVGLLLGVAMIPLLAFAEGVPDFQPIVPIANITTVEDISFIEYVNQLFKISISIGAILSVLMIIYGGFEYMTSEALGGKKGGLSKIQNAITGLLLLVAVVILLQVINPCILDIHLFTRESSTCSPPPMAAEENSLGQVNVQGYRIGIRDPSSEISISQNASRLFGPEGSLRPSMCSGDIADICYPTYTRGQPVPRALQGRPYTPRTGATCTETNYIPMETCEAAPQSASEAVNLTTLPTGRTLMEDGGPDSACAGPRSSIQRYCCTEGVASCVPISGALCTTGAVLKRVCIGGN